MIRTHVLYLCQLCYNLAYFSLHRHTLPRMIKAKVGSCGPCNTRHVYLSMIKSNQIIPIVYMSNVCPGQALP